MLGVPEDLEGGRSFFTSFEGGEVWSFLVVELLKIFIFKVVMEIL